MSDLYEDNKRQTARIPIVLDSYEHAARAKDKELLMDYLNNDIYIIRDGKLISITGALRDQISSIQDGSMVVHIVTEATLPPIKDREKNHWYYVVLDAETVDEKDDVDVNKYIFYGVIKQKDEQDKNYILIGQNMLSGEDTVKVNALEGYKVCFYVPVRLNPEFYRLDGTPLEFEVVKRLYVLTPENRTELYDIYMSKDESLGEIDISLKLIGESTLDQYVKFTTSLRNLTFNVESLNALEFESSSGMLEVNTVSTQSAEGSIINQYNVVVNGAITNDIELTVRGNIIHMTYPNAGVTGIEIKNCINLIDIFADRSQSRATQITNTHAVTLKSFVIIGETSIENMEYKFYECADLKTIRLDYNSTNNVQSLLGTFSGCTSLQSISLFDTTNVTSMVSTFSRCASLKSVPLFDTSNVTNMDNMFTGCESLTTIPAFDTSKVTSMNFMFSGCSLLATISQLNTMNVTSMDNMFNGCAALVTIPQLDTSNVGSMQSMFNGCTALQNIPLLDTHNVSSMYVMFGECSSLTTIPQLDTSDVRIMDKMFINCTKLETIPMLDLSRVTSMNNMFENCTALTVVPQIQIPNCTALDNTFKGCSALTTCKLGQLMVTIDFSDCPNLNKESIEYIFLNVQTVTNQSNINITGCAGYSKIYATSEAGKNVISKGWVVVPELIAIIEGLTAEPKYVAEGETFIGKDSAEVQVGTMVVDSIIDWK